MHILAKVPFIFFSERQSYCWLNLSIHGKIILLMILDTLPLYVLGQYIAFISYLSADIVYCLLLYLITSIKSVFSFTKTLVYRHYYKIYIIVLNLNIYQYIQCLYYISAFLISKSHLLINLEFMSIIVLRLVFLVL